MSWRCIGKRLCAVAAGLALAFLAGCGGERYDVPAYAPGKMAQSALDLYDTNKDGRLDSEELKKCPSLAEARASLDRNGDKSVDAEELEARFKGLTVGEIGLMGMSARLTRDGQALSGATVTLEPEPFMLGAVKPAAAVSDASGSVVFKTEGFELPGVQPGFYRVRVSHKNPAGNETVSPRYNTQTTLGREIPGGMRGTWEIRVGSES